MIIRRWIATLLAVSAMLVLASPAAWPRPSEYSNAHLLVSTADLVRQLGRPDMVILDVRPRDAYDEGHIPGAVHLGADDVIDPSSPVEGALLPDETLAQMLGERGIGTDTKVVLYDDKGGFHAARLFWMLEYFGHRHASVLNGGITKWLAEGRQVSTAAPAVGKAKFTLTLSERRLATADWLMDRRADPSVVVIDVRPSKMFKAGHIPWARSIPWTENLTADQTLKPAADLMAHFRKHGVTPDKNVAVHCQQGKAAGHTYFTLRVLGFPQVRSYDRSWAEWGMADDLPKKIPASDSSQ